MNRKDKKFLQTILLILMMKTRTEVSFLGDPHLGIFLVHANRRLTHEFDFFGMELYDEHEFLQGQFSYTAFADDSCRLSDACCEYLNNMSDDEFMKRQKEVLNGKIY